jgi:long-chain acyl-CoA synthetase
MSLEQLDPPARLFNPGRAAAWLAKQVELGLAGVDLSLSQYRILGVLAEGSAMSSSLAERLAVRPPSITAVIDGLVARGLVARTHSEDDRRRIALELTTEGRSLLESADRAVRDRLEHIASGLGPKAAAKAIESLTLWQDALYAHWAARTGR